MEMSRRHIRHLVVVERRRAGRRALDARHRARAGPSEGATSGMSPPESEQASTALALAGCAHRRRRQRRRGHVAAGAAGGEVVARCRATQRAQREQPQSTAPATLQTQPAKIPTRIPASPNATNTGAHEEAAGGRPARSGSGCAVSLIAPSADVEDRGEEGEAEDERARARPTRRPLMRLLLCAARGPSRRFYQSALSRAIAQNSSAR